MHPRLAQAMQTEALKKSVEMFEALPNRLEALEQKVDRILDLLTAPSPPGTTLKRGKSE